jgi:hypothetical protein
MSALIGRGKIKWARRVSSPGQVFGLTFLLMIELIRTIIGNSVLRRAMGVRIDIA